VGSVRGDQVVAGKGGPPIALAARHENGLAPFVGERIESRRAGRSLARRSRLRVRGSARTSAHDFSPVGSCGCDHERRLTASRACTMAAISLATSGRLRRSSASCHLPQSLSGVRHGPSVTLNRRYQPREEVRRHGVQQDRHRVARDPLGPSRHPFGILGATVLLGRYLSKVHGRRDRAGVHK
jgi:hypothetical protein